MKPTPLSFHRIVALVCAGCLIGFTAHAQTPEADAQKKLQAKFEEAKVKALASDPAAQYTLAECYRRGKGVAANPEEMMKWYLKSAQLNYAAAQYSLGQCYAKPPGPFMKQDLVEAYAWMTVGHGNIVDITPGMSPAQLEAGKKRALVLEKQIQSALAAARPAVQAEAEKQRDAELVRVFQECKVKAEAGDAAAQYQLAELYGAGKGVKQDLNEANKWLFKSALFGNGAAQNTLAAFPDGKFGHPGQVIIIDREHKSHLLVESYAWYNVMFKTKSYDVRETPEQLAKEIGLTPQGLTPQEVAAGNKRAAELLAQIEANLKSLPAKPKPAPAPMRAQTVDPGLKAKADAGDAAAQFQLFEMYRDGKGMKRDLNESNKWLFKSALSGNADAQDVVAGKYLNEWKDNQVEAYGWMSVIAKRNGIRSGGPQDAFAKEKGLTPQQVAAGKKCAEELLAEIEANRKSIRNTP